MENTYLTVITTVLVVTQVIRIIQNTINLVRQNRLLKAQMKELDDITNDDIKRKREVDILLLEYLKRNNECSIDD